MRSTLRWCISPNKVLHLTDTIFDYTWTACANKVTEKWTLEPCDFRMPVGLKRCKVCDDWRRTQLLMLDWDFRQSEDCEDIKTAWNFRSLDFLGHKTKNDVEGK